MPFTNKSNNFFFESGKLSIVMDGGAGSSGKGTLASFISEHANNWQFACNTFMPQAGHWVRLDDGTTYFYQTFNSCAYQDTYDKMYMGPGSIIEKEAFFREIEENNIHPSRIGISPLVSILQPEDSAYERGEVTLEGVPLEQVGDGTMKKGSTAHGVGACRARRILRRPEVILARDDPEFAEFLCDVPNEIMRRLDSGQAGLLEIAQGFQLSCGLPEFYPYCTSRNVTVAAAMDDMMLPITYAGNVVINFRTYPIRINNLKFRDGGRHLTWEEVEEYKAAGKEYETYEGNSGPGYPDQEEIDWDILTKSSGSPEQLMEITSVTKLPRRVFTFSKQNLIDAVKYNKTPGTTYLSINFMNYVDNDIAGVRSDEECYGNVLKHHTPQISGKCIDWLRENIPNTGGTDWTPTVNAKLAYLGTGPLTNDKIILR